MFFKPLFWEKKEAVSLFLGYQVHAAENYVANVLRKLEKFALSSGTISSIISQKTLPAFCPADLGEEGYALEITRDSVTLYGNTASALGFAAVMLLQMAEFGELFTGTLYDAPDCSFRGYRAYLPSRNYLDDFYGMVDFIQYYKFNTLILEVGGAMEYKSHPEINVAWKAFADETHRYSG
ncbi:MAG: hypothetical protein II348_01505, partial [Clostridia bacterium]|nr:hypothetical protein [Clostridia bacterium]